MIERIAISHQSFCIICGNWDKLDFHDYTLGTQCLCKACAGLVVDADNLLFRVGLKAPPTELIYSREHKLG
jgi:hypothetical protein